MNHPQRVNSGEHARHVRLTRLLGVVVCVGLVISLSASSATAQTRHVKDRRDSYGMPPKVEAPKDIRRVRFVNGKKRVRAVIRVRRLWPRSTGWAQLNLATADYSRSAHVTVIRRKSGRQFVRTSGLRRCGKLRARYVIRRNQVRFSFPQRCLRDRGRHAWRMDAYLGGLPIRNANAWDASRTLRVRYN